MSKKVKKEKIKDKEERRKYVKSPTCQARAWRIMALTKKLYYQHLDVQRLTILFLLWYLFNSLILWLMIYYEKYYVR